MILCMTAVCTPLFVTTLGVLNGCSPLAVEYELVIVIESLSKQW